VSRSVQISIIIAYKRDIFTLIGYLSQKSPALLARLFTIVILAHCHEHPCRAIPA